MQVQLSHREESTVLGSTFSTTLSSVLSKSGIASTTGSPSELFDSGVFDRVRVFVNTAVTLTIRCSLVKKFPIIGNCSFIMVVQIRERLYLRNYTERLLKFVSYVSIKL